MSNMTKETAVLNRTQAEALKRIRDRGPEAWCGGGRAGGATGRMFDRMTTAGLCTRPPHQVTLKGHAALAKFHEAANLAAYHGDIDGDLEGAI